jgi:hypothetical protein
MFGWTAVPFAQRNRRRQPVAVIASATLGHNAAQRAGSAIVEVPAGQPARPDLKDPNLT